jgi:hypothetical protein
MPKVKVINPVNNTISSYPKTTIIRSCGCTSEWLYHQTTCRVYYKRYMDEIYYSYKRLGFRVCARRLK